MEVEVSKNVVTEKFMISIREIDTEEELGFLLKGIGNPQVAKERKTDKKVAADDIGSNNKIPGNLDCSGLTLSDCHNQYGYEKLIELMKPIFGGENIFEQSLVSMIDFFQELLYYMFCVIPDLVPQEELLKHYKCIFSEDTLEDIYQRIHDKINRIQQIKNVLTNHKLLLEEYTVNGLSGIEKELRNSKQGNSHTGSSYKDVVTFVSIFFSNINFMPFEEFYAAFNRYVPATLPEDYRKNPMVYSDVVRTLDQRMLASIK